MAEAPNAELACRWQSWQWQMYNARGFSVGVLKLTAPHWQLASMVMSFVWCCSAKRELCCLKWSLGEYANDKDVSRDRKT
jgi:hypothetical protein